MPSVLIWLNAFIPRTVFGYTKTVPAGTHSSKTAVPLPKVARLWPGNLLKDIDAGYLTDQRDFSSDPAASVRMQSLAELDVPTLALIRQVHRSSGTTEVNLVTGKQTGYEIANMSRCRFEVTAPTGNTPGGFGAHFVAARSTAVPAAPARSVPSRYGSAQIRLVGAGGDPLVGMAADIDYEGTFLISGGNAPGSLTIEFEGKIDSFTGFESYALFNGLTKNIFKSSPPFGNTVVNLLGRANRPISGKAVFSQ